MIFNDQDRQWNVFVGRHQGGPYGSANRCRGCPGGGPQVYTPAYFFWLDRIPFLCYRHSMWLYPGWV